MVAARRRGRHRVPLRGRSKRSRGSSTVVGTIFVLAITVVLASAVFLWVLTYPSYATQPQDRFNVALAFGGKTCLSKCGGGSPVFATAIQSISITLVSGPQVLGSSTTQSSIRLVSQQKPASFAAPFALSAGLAGSAAWLVGQTWTISLATYGLPFYDNLTVLVTSNHQLVLQTVAPGANTPAPPYFTGATVSPSHPATHQAFLISCWVVAALGINASKPVTVNLSQIAGLPSTPQTMTFSASTGAYTYNVSAGVATAGTYNVFLVAKDTQGQTNQFLLRFQVG
ncbi:MAG TPA: archaellin/type IV pilin N-terminal domain-containing protein [Thermoplasmata archaeon]|nr:archaellin/type IV pilin N-terminal domain-containing protein [Thermoplasmata archaeon]